MTRYKAVITGDISDLASMFEKNFSSQELGDMLIFFESPTGQSFLKKMPEMNLQLLSNSMTRMFSDAKRMNAKLKERAVKLGLKPTWDY